MSKSTLDQFVAKVKSEGLLLGSHFYVIITPPFTWEADARDVMMLCDSVNMPSHTVGTSDVRIFGENREHAYMPLYGSVSASFILDRNMRVKQFFENWMSLVVNRNSRTVGYYYDFIAPIEIYVTDKNSKVVHAIRCYDVFPKNISEISLNYSSNEVLRLNVEFSIRYWESLPVNEEGQVNENYALGSEDIFARIKGFSREQIERAGIISVVEPLGSSLGFKSSGSFGLTGNFVKDITSLGNSFGSDSNRALNASYALIQSSPGSNSASKSFADSLQSLGSAAGKLGSAIAGIGQGIREVAAPAVALANASVGVANVLGTINATTSALGLGTPFAGAQASLTNVVGKIAVVSNAGGLSNPLSSLGSSLGAIGGGFQSITNSVKSIPGGTDRISQSISSIGSVFSRTGYDVQQSSSTLGDGVNSGKYT